MLIFSTPTASATSDAPERSCDTASEKAEAPVAQAFSTLYTGIRWTPISRRAI